MVDGFTLSLSRVLNSEKDIFSQHPNNNDDSKKGSDSVSYYNTELSKIKPEFKKSTTYPYIPEKINDKEEIKEIKVGVFF